jgi:hypothetical protein
VALNYGDKILCRTFPQSISGRLPAIMNSANLPITDSSAKTNPDNHIIGEFIMCPKRRFFYPQSDDKSIHCENDDG